jgi:hypothetical protein
MGTGVALAVEIVGWARGTVSITRFFDITITGSFTTDKIGDLEGTCVLIATEIISRTV